MRGAVSLRGLHKAFAGVTAVHDVSLDVRPGEFLTLLGPSGCGKTTLLRLVAGFERPDAGEIAISGRPADGLPPHARPVNTVFQHYALFPHRDVAGNVAFGLEMARVPRAQVASRVAKALEMVRLPGFERRRVDQLSGGQRQRVALARAVVLEPEVLLLDEPMAALDAQLRKEMQIEVKNLQERLATTFVFVTHDQEEALIMSDRIGVMNAGRLEQTGDPESLYERPRTRFVAEFMAVKNLLPALVTELRAGEALLRAEAGFELVAKDDGGYRAGAAALVGVRPERLGLGERDGLPALRGTLEDEIYLGDRTDWRVRVGDAVLTVSEGALATAPRRRGDPVVLHYAPASLLRLEES